jgi:tetratricopeptide (TPR) repeat protein
MYAQGGNPDQAIADFSKAIELRPDFANAYNNRSYAYEAKKNYTAALDDVLKAKVMHFAVDEGRITQLSGKGQ